MENVRHQVRIIDLGQVQKNVKALREEVPASAMLMAVVKADAYGHGAVQVSKAALTAGAAWLAVATVEEGCELREAGIQAPILVLGATSPSEAFLGTAHQLTLTVCSPEMVSAVEEAAKSLDQVGQVHLKIDTGMRRIGVRNEAELGAMLDAFAACPHVSLTGVFTHLANADGENEAFTKAQVDRFTALSALLPHGIIRHCANSAAIHRYMPETAFNMVRMGISLYGYPPVSTQCPVAPCLSWTTEVTYVKKVEAGDTIGYGRTFSVDHPMKIATVACGYGDGYHRAASGKAQVILHGQKAPVIGRICMDQMMVDVTEIDQVTAGDKVTLLGRDGDASITAEDIAQWAGTISYEVLLAATNRVPRIWKQ